MLNHTYDGEENEHHSRLFVNLESEKITQHLSSLDAVEIKQMTDRQGTGCLFSTYLYRHTRVPRCDPETMFLLSRFTAPLKAL
jgi:hypothetical protein